jgi:hypothetical protein
MSSLPIHAPTRSGYRGVIRYSLCVLVVAIACVVSLDRMLWFFRGLSYLLTWCEGYVHLRFYDDGLIWWTALPAFLSAAVALIAWRFRKTLNEE